MNHKCSNRDELYRRARLAAVLAVSVATIAFHVVSAQEPSRSKPYHPTHVLVRFKSQVSDASLNASHQAADAVRTLHNYDRTGGLKLVEVPEGDVETAVAAYRQRPDVLYAQPDHIFHLTGFPNEAETPTAEFDKQWPLLNRGQTIQGQTGNVDSDIDANVACNFWQGDADFRVAVIDTGVDYLHPDLAANIWTNSGEVLGDGNGDGCPGVCGQDDDGDGLIDEDCKDRLPTDEFYWVGCGGQPSNDDDENGWADDIYGYDFVDPAPEPDPRDEDGHGTHVAGIIAAIGDNELGVVGVNWRAKIVALRACSGDTCLESNLVSAVQYCINNNIKLSNNSYAFCAQSSSYPAALYDRFKQARDQIGHLAVAGAGNYIPFVCAGLNNDLSAVWPAGFGEDEPNNPGLGSVIAVAATNNQDRLWASGGSESHYGANSVHLAAPGQDVCSTERVPDPGCPDPSQDSCEAIGNSCYSFQTGTSMAAPHVTGVAALLWSQVPTWDYLAVKNRILGSVRVLNCSTEDASCIVGRTITGGVVSARGAIWDCNNNTIDDDVDITNGPSQDCSGTRVTAVSPMRVPIARTLRFGIASV